MSSRRVRPRPPRVRAVPAVTRALAILRILARSPQALGVHAIARELGLVPSTCLHILRALAAEELVAVDAATRRYELGAGILPLARSFLRRDRFADAVQPALDELAERHGVTAIGVEVFGLEHMIAVAIAEADLPLRIQVHVGSRFPALISATGRCLAAFSGHPWRELERRFRRLRWDRPPPFARWRREIEATRRSGFGIDEGSYIRGITVVAVPLLDAGGHMSHGLAAVAVSERLTPSATSALVADLRRLADAVGERLAGGARSLSE